MIDTILLTHFKGKYVSSRLWLRLTLFEPKSLEKSGMPYRLFKVVGVFSVELLTYQWSALQIGQDSSSYIPDKILG